MGYHAFKFPKSSIVAEMNYSFEYVIESIMHALGIVNEPFPNTLRISCDTAPKFGS